MFSLRLSRYLRASVSPQHIFIVKSVFPHSLAVVASASHAGIPESAAEDGGWEAV